MNQVFRGSYIFISGTAGFNIYCKTCFRGNKESVTNSCYSDCAEMLCSICDVEHMISKQTLPHTAVAVDKISSTTIIFSKALCETDPQITVEFYCSKHSLLCCRACILQYSIN